jgi:hypothetical protein
MRGTHWLGTHHGLPLRRCDAHVDLWQSWRCEGRVQDTHCLHAWSNVLGGDGATILADMGFEPKGTNLSLVMIDKDGRHLAETRLDELMKELHIDKSRVTVSHKCT